MARDALVQQLMSLGAVEAFRTSSDAGESVSVMIDGNGPHAKEFVQAVLRFQTQRAAAHPLTRAETASQQQDVIATLHDCANEQVSYVMGLEPGAMPSSMHSRESDEHKNNSLPGAGPFNYTERIFNGALNHSAVGLVATTKGTDYQASHHVQPFSGGDSWFGASFTCPWDLCYFFHSATPATNWFVERLTTDCPACAANYLYAYCTP